MFWEAECSYLAFIFVRVEQTLREGREGLGDVRARPHRIAFLEWRLPDSYRSGFGVLREAAGVTTETLQGLGGGKGGKITNAVLI